MLRDIIICMAPGYEDKFSRQWSRHAQPDESFPAIIVFSSETPEARAVRQAEYSRYHPAVLLIYIGQDIAEPREHQRLVELPASILDSPTEFDKELAQRIRDYLGS